MKSLIQALLVIMAILVVTVLLIIALNALEVSA